jgi:membrane protein YdbS with pleckstrin-like domain
VEEPRTPERQAAVTSAALWPGDVEWRSVSPKLIVLRRLSLVYVLVAALIVAGVLYAVTGSTTSSVALLVLTVCLLAWWWVIVGRAVRSWGYAERDDDLLIRHGVLIQRLTIVPYGRMQYVDVSAGPIERVLDLATVQLHTAAAATDAHIPGLPGAEAARLREKLAALGQARAAGL